MQTSGLRLLTCASTQGLQRSPMLTSAAHLLIELVFKNLILCRVNSDWTEEHAAGTNSGHASQQLEHSGHALSDHPDGRQIQTEREYNQGRNQPSLRVTSEGPTARIPGAIGVEPPAMGAHQQSVTPSLFSSEATASHIAVDPCQQCSFPFFRSIPGCVSLPYL